jgi:hypothetical protein
MRLSFKHFDGGRIGCVDVVDLDSGKVIGHIQSDGVGFGNGGGIYVCLFDAKYAATVRTFDECKGFVMGVESVLRHITAMPNSVAGSSAA